MADQKIQTTATPEQLLYADILEKGMFAGLALIIVTFVLYLTGIMSPVVPLDQIAGYWAMPVKDYLNAINTNFLGWAHPPTGWSWVKLIGKGDFLNFLPIAILSGVTMVCYAAIVPGLFKRGDKAYAVMAIAEVLILGLAASGLLSAGGH